MRATTVIFLGALASGEAAAQTLPHVQTALAEDDITVVAPSPVPGSSIAATQTPEATNLLGSKDIVRTGIPSLTEAILDNIPGATVNDVESNPFQPDILFRGFTASPVAGTPESLAVYVNGARFNDAFGDTVNWDLIPSIAIKSVNVESANPVFGLNALGGSVNVQLKNGFNTQGGDFTGYGGSFGRGSGSLEWGQQSGNFGFYAAGEIIHDDGFRETQASDIYRFNTDLGYRTDAAELHLNITAADNTLGNPGASPVQALDANIANIFTAPNTVSNKYVAVNLNGTVEITDTLSLQAVGYFQDFSQRVPNGATADVAPCNDGTNYLCNDDGTVVTGRNNVPVTAFLGNGPYSSQVNQGLDSHAYGASLQATETGDLAGLHNHLVVGASFDGSNSLFDGTTEIGGFNPYTREFIGPYVTQDQPSEATNPVRVATTTRYFALFAADRLTLLPDLDLDVGARFNNAEVDLADKNGGPVSGQNAFNRFNPTAGLTYTFSPALQAYANYAETNREPTPQELSCASATNACSLLSFFVGDPPLKQVVSRTFEGGLRGTLASIAGGKLGWNVDYFHTKNHDDLVYETTLFNPNLAYYTNAGQTLRQGVEANLHYDTGRLHTVLGYAFTDATFQTPLLLGSDSNPDADANGNIHVMPGDRIPGIPRHRGTVLADYALTDRWTIGGNVILQSSQYRFGDEANQTKPVGGYVVVNFDTSYRITPHIMVFGVVNNVFNQRYDTYGTFGPIDAVPWPNIPGGVTDPREGVPGMPIAGYGGVKVSF